MSNSPQDSIRQRLAAYLDGTLSERARTEFVRELEANPGLQAELQQQKKIDESLARAFRPPAPPADLLAQLRQATEDSTIRYPARRRWAMIAAAAAATIAWAFLGWQFFSPANRPPVYNPKLPLATIYKTRVESGFKPTWVCEDDHVFASTFFERQGQGLLLAAMPQGSGMVGLTYCGGLSRYTTTMLARVEGEPVMVFVDRRENDEEIVPPDPQSGLHLFRKELSDLVLYELTPFTEPRVMEYLYQAAVPPAKSPPPAAEESGSSAPR